MSPTSLPNIPWEDRTSGDRNVVWRYSGNPIIPRDLIPSSNSIFNSAVVPYNGKFSGVFKCPRLCWWPGDEFYLHLCFSLISERSLSGSVEQRLSKKNLN